MPISALHLSSAVPVRLPPPSWQVLALAVLPLLCGLAVLPLGFDGPMLFRDPAATTHRPPYLGLFSNLGVLCWAAAAVSAGVAALAMPASAERLALAAGAALSAVLCFDDLLMVHKAVAPRFGVPEKIVVASYAVAILLYVWRFRTFHLRMDWPLFLAALGLLGASAAFDMVSRDTIANVVIEDAMKFGGVVAWAGFHLFAALRCLRAALTPPAIARHPR